MLAFVTSLRHPQNSEDYGRVEALLKNSLQSIHNQSSDDHMTIVVGNVAPAFELPPRTSFVKVDFDAPAPPDGPSMPRDAFVRDKGTKIGIGLVAARDHHPDHVMIFDADDFIHRDVARWVSTQPSSAGWVVRKGWMYSRARNSYRPVDAFNRTCGTCHIIPFDVYGVPEHLTADSSQEEVIDAYGDRLLHIMGAHRDAERWFSAHGLPLGTVPFRAAVYHVDTGENHSGKTMSGLAHPLGARMRRDFSVPPSLGPLSTAAAAVGPRSIWRSSTGRVKHVLRRARAAGPA